MPLQSASNPNTDDEDLTPGSVPRAFYVDPIMAELTRTGASGWRLAAGTGWREMFKGKDFEHADAIELDREDWAALIRRGPELLRLLATVPDGAGDEAVADALGFWE